MKKLFLLALILLMVSSFAFAVSKNAEATLSLNLTGSVSILNVGFADAATMELETITSSSKNVEKAISVEKDTTPGAELVTAEKTFCIFWYMNAIKGAEDTGVKLVVTFNPFTSTGEGGTGDTLPYKITPKTATADGNDKITASLGNAEISISKEEPISVFEVKSDYSGLSRGYIPITINKIDYSSVQQGVYTAIISMSITAP